MFKTPETVIAETLKRRYSGSIVAMAITVPNASTGPMGFVLAGMADKFVTWRFRVDYFENRACFHNGNYFEHGTPASASMRSQDMEVVLASRAEAFDDFVSRVSQDLAR